VQPEPNLANAHTAVEKAATDAVCYKEHLNENAWQ